MKEPSPHRFTMQQEARNTETHTRSWSHSNLRHKAVQFVSAGQLQRTEPDVDEEGGSRTEIQLEVTELEIQGTPEVKEDVGDNLFFLDTVGEEVVHTGLPDPTLHSDFSDSEGSEDEVVFTGRRKPIAIETDEAELREYLQKTQNVLLQAAASSEDVQPNRQVTVAETPPAPRTQKEHHTLSDGEAHKPADSTAIKDHGSDQEHAQISTEAEGGIGVGRPLSGSELDTEGSQSVQTEASQFQLKQYASKGQAVEDAEDAEVIGSIDGRLLPIVRIDVIQNHPPLPK
ncbi:hypothetical protein N7504_004917 [Penicillium tannophilum]|nr:hypothetical protein N7504_004917 [Penicillium tannophilum]